jgi:transcriptional regulator with XRE-family HTH domain
MITNERQYKITKAEIRRFEEAIARGEREHPDVGVHPVLHEAMLEGFRSQLEELRDDLSAYEALREGKVKRRKLYSLIDLPLTLIEGRIASRLTQKELAKRLGVPEQQVQRYERTQYAGVALDRLQQVADAIGVRMEKTVEFNVSPPARSKRAGSKPRAATAKRAALSQARERSGKKGTSAAGSSRTSTGGARRSQTTALAQRKSSEGGGKKGVTRARKAIPKRNSATTKRSKGKTRRQKN